MALNEREKKFEERHAEELGAKRYALKQLKQWAINLGAPLAGTLGGFGIGSLFRNSKSWEDGNAAIKAMGAETLPGFKNVSRMQGAMAGVGFFAGAIVAGIVELYEHWRQVEGARIAAAEVNEDVSNMKIRMRTDPELLRENERLRKMLEVEEKKNAGLAATAHAPVGPTTRLQPEGREHDSRVIDPSARSLG